MCIYGCLGQNKKLIVSNNTPQNRSVTEETKEVLYIFYNLNEVNKVNVFGLNLNGK